MIGRYAWKYCRPLSYAVIPVFLFFTSTTLAQDPWESITYPDEEGFQMRMKPMVDRIASQSFAQRSQASSRCPDTGLPVKTWALEGETIYSPYTGRAYKQGNTGYFGPKERNENGEIIAFGGDPLKYELSPAAASIFLQDERSEQAVAFLSIPGNLRQQYHFACSNWARAYPLIEDKMPDRWKADFYQWIAIYEEKRRPSDGARENSHISHPHNLVGQQGELLGGNPFDGGTENHKTMWRTSALLYSQLLPDSAKISGYSIEDAKAITKEMIRDYLKKMLTVGNGEYDSKVYYPYTIKSFMNLYDFSPDPEIKELAQAVLDLYFATYGIKTMDGYIAGAQKRGYLSGTNPDMMEIMQWGFFNETSRAMDEATATLHQSTTTYRPNKVIWNLTRKNVALPYEAKMSRPFYHMDHPHAFAETFYCSDSYALGNMQMTIVDNPNQQMIWSLVAKGTDGPLCFSGGHPMRGSTSGHSPYTQTLHKKGVLILVTAPTQTAVADTAGIARSYKETERINLWIMPKSEQPADFEVSHRQKYAIDDLRDPPHVQKKSINSIDEFWQDSKGSASSWLYFPKEFQPRLIDGIYFLEANKVYVAVRPISNDHFVLNPKAESVAQVTSREAKRFFDRYGLISFNGKVSGYVMEAAESSDYDSLEDFAASIISQTQFSIALDDTPTVSYRSLTNDQLELKYRPQGLRCEGTINGVLQNWDQHTNGAVYESPYLRIKDGAMNVTDGESSYTFDFTGDKPVWK